MAQQGIEMVRYADDFMILCRSEAEAGSAGTGTAMDGAGGTDPAPGENADCGCHPDGGL